MSSPADPLALRDACPCANGEPSVVLFATAVNERLDAGWSVQEVAAELDSTASAVRAAIIDDELEPVPENLGRWLTDQARAALAEHQPDLLELIDAPRPGRGAPGVELVAATHPDELDRIADTWPDQDSWTVRNLRTQARSRRDNTHNRRLAQTWLLPRRPHVGTARGAGRPRARRAASSRAGPSDDSGESAGDGDGWPPPALLRALHHLELALHQVRWCRLCHCFAFCVDSYERQRLDEAGFDRLCPSCRREGGS